MTIFFHKNFSKNYKKLSETVRKQFKHRLMLFVENPFHPLLNNHVLHGEWQNFRSINITGNIRAIYQPIGDYTAEFVIIDTHSNLY
jgi:addiction module RelE/StbE family toxin